MNNEEIKSLQFKIFTSDKIIKNSQKEITNKQIYTEKRQPETDGPLDTKLGPLSGTDLCTICNQREECPGHFGHINLILPVFHCGYLKIVYNILNCVCISCSRLYVEQKMSLSDLIIASRKIKKCLHCNQDNQTVKRGSGYKFLIGTTDLDALAVYNIFSFVRKADYHFFGLDSSPVELLIVTFPVPPNIIRPSVKMLTSSNEDDLTIKVAEIIQANEQLKNGIERGCALSMLQDDWDYLQLQVNLFINSDLPMYTRSDANLRKIRGIVQRLKGKHGRFRGNLSGKRVDFSGRTVISPDPNLSVEEVGVPQHLCEILTVPEVVTDFNFDKLTTLVGNGIKYPGANFVTTENGRVSLKYARKDHITLKTGDTVDRHLQAGDYVLFNRQPSLHRISIMAHKVLPHENKTLRFNECVCTPYNADFDGDEMNLHVPQSLEAMAEARCLLNVGSNLCTPRNGEPLVACTQDFITGMFLLTGKNIFMKKSLFSNLCASFADLGDIKSTRGCFLRPVILYSGKQVFDVLLDYSLKQNPNLEYCEKIKEYNKHPKNNSQIDNKNRKHDFEDIKKDKYLIDNFETKHLEFKDAYNLNLVSKNRSHRQSLEKIPFNDTLVCIKNNHYYFGQIDKSIIGSENKSQSLIYALIQISPKCAIVLMNSISKLSSLFISNYGFSMGLNDVEPTINIKMRKNNVVQKIYNECEDKIKLFYENKLEILPGCTALESLESVVSCLLSKIRDDLGSTCIEVDTAPVLMQFAGSKGSKINVAQMTACVGQQIISGKRISDGFVCNIEDRNSEDVEIIGIIKARDLLNYDETEIDQSSEDLENNAQDFLFMANEQKSINDILENRNSIDSQSEKKQIRYTNPKTVHQINSRTLPHFHSGNALTPQAKGFVKNSFYSGLTPTEFFFHAVSGREGLVDTAVKTAETGYMQRRLMKALEDLKTNYDKTIRNAENEIVKFISDDEPGTAVGAIAGQSIGEPGTQMTLKTFHFAGVASMNITLGVPRLKEIINATKNIHTPLIKAELCDFDKYYAKSIKKDRKNTNSNKHVVDSMNISDKDNKNDFKKGIMKFDEQNYSTKGIMKVDEQNDIAINNLNNNSTDLSLDKVKNKDSETQDLSQNDSQIPGKSEEKTLMLENEAECQGVQAQKSDLNDPTSFNDNTISKNQEKNNSINSNHNLNIVKIEDETKNNNLIESIQSLKDNIDSDKTKQSMAINDDTINNAIIERGKNMQILHFAQKVKAKIEKTYLKDICTSLMEIYGTKKSYIELEIDVFKIKELNLEITLESIRISIEKSLKIQKEYIEINQNKITIIIKKDYYTFKSIKRKILDIIVNGIKTISRCVVNKEKDTYNLIIEGHGLQNVLSTLGVKTATTNNSLEINEVLGIEAARQSIINEILYTMENHGITIDHKHVELLADTMTYKGFPLGITRFGISKMKISTLMLASFEQTAEHLFNSAVKGVVDDVLGVSESIILGKKMNVGTGVVELIHNPEIQ